MSHSVALIVQCEYYYSPTTKKCDNRADRQTMDKVIPISCSGKCRGHKQ